MDKLDTLLTTLLVFLAVGTLALLAVAATAAPLDDAIAIVVEESARIAKREDALHQKESTPEWEAKVSLSTSYAEKQTTEFAGGPDARAQLSVSIPLFSTKKRQEVSGALYDLRVEEQTVLEKFLASVSSLVITQRKIGNARELYRLKLDKLEYFKKADKDCRETKAKKTAQETGKEECVIQSHELWPYAEEAKQAEQAVSLALDSYKAELEQVARQFGGARWKALKAHLDTHAQAGQP
jgi:hypothetical protein